MEMIFASICAAVIGGEVNVSDNLVIACVNNEMPELTASGDFPNRGIGSELNFIVANTQVFTFVETADLQEQTDVDPAMLADQS